jgi:hypothetical protein
MDMTTTKTPKTYEQMHREILRDCECPMSDSELLDLHTQGHKLAELVSEQESYINPGGKTTTAEAVSAAVVIMMRVPEMIHVLAPALERRIPKPNLLSLIENLLAELTEDAAKETRNARR